MANWRRKSTIDRYSWVSSARSYFPFSRKQFFADLLVQFIEQFIDEGLVEFGKPEGIFEVKICPSVLPTGNEARIRMPKTPGHFFLAKPHATTIFF
jgi:hypothetical protein